MFWGVQFSSQTGNIHSYYTLYVKGVCKPPHPVRVQVVGEGLRSHFPPKDEQWWLRIALREGVAATAHLQACHPIQPFTGKGARIGHTRACFKRQMLVHSVRALLAFTLTAPPTVCSYITPSPSAGPLPAFIGLFLAFSTLALHPTDRWLSPPIILCGSFCHNCVLSFPMCRGHFGTETMKAGSFPWRSIKVDITSLKTGLCRIPQGVLQTSGVVIQNTAPTWITK